MGDERFPATEFEEDLNDFFEDALDHFAVGFEEWPRFKRATLRWLDEQDRQQDELAIQLEHEGVGE